MMKFFRKYNRQLLAVFMALLLVVWLGGSALTAMIAPSPAEFVRATSHLGDIREADVQLAEFETQQLQNLRLQWRRPWIGNPPVDHEPLELFDWILLTREAAQWGMVARRADVDQLLGALNLTPDVVYQFAAALDVPADRIYSAIAKYIGVWRTLRQTVARSDISEAKVRIATRAELEKVRIEAAPVRAGSYLDNDETFSEEAMQAHFEEYRAVEPVSGIEFGYRQPPRLRFQYIRVDSKEVANNLRIREATLDARAREFWRLNRRSDQFRKAPEIAEGDTTMGDPSKWPFFESYEDAREVALRLVRQQLASAEIQSVANWLQEQVQDPWFGIEKGEDGYKAGTENLLREDFFQRIVARLPANLTYGDAVTVVETDFFHIDKLINIQDLGPSYRSVGNRRINFRTVAGQVQGLMPMPTDPGVDTTFFLAIGQPVPMVMYNAREQAFIYRVMEVKQAGPAEDLDVVRDQVLNDMRLLEGYKRAQDMAEKLRLTATGMGLVDGFNAMKDELEATPFPTRRYAPEPFGRVQSGKAGQGGDNQTVYIPGIATVSPAFVEACFALEDEPGPFRVAALEIPSAAKIVVVEFVERIPVREDTYAVKRADVVRAMEDEAAAEAIREWLTPQRIRDRNGFELVQQ